jgi:uncharacterized protein YoaH (UPF0181 family)
MGFWKNVSMDVAKGMSIEKATALNAEQMYGNKVKAAKMAAKFEAELKLDKIR